jgi:hypothetical protein
MADNEARIKLAVQALVQARVAETLAAVQEACDSIAGTHAGRPEEVVRVALEDAFRQRGIDPAAAPPFAAAIAAGQRVRITAKAK